MRKSEQVAILGSGPAGLMAATALASEGVAVRVFDKRRAAGRKLLIAGSSGLNIGTECSREEWLQAYAGPRERFAAYLDAFSPEQWRAWIESELGIPVFKGTSRRWFIQTEGMKAPALLKAWTEWLQKRGVVFELGRECVGFARAGSAVELVFADGTRESVDAACLALGGGSWETPPPSWPRLFGAESLAPFMSSNAGFAVAWPEALLKEAEGKPIKNIVLTSPKATRAGDLVITSYGLEGTPVYFAGATGMVTLDLKPDLTHEQLSRRMELERENLSPVRRVKRHAGLGEGALALLYHMTSAEDRASLPRLLERIKRFELRLGEPRPLAEAISSSGGLKWEELDATLMLKRCAGVFAAGEMLDWDAPTGGYLIQGCVSQGWYAGRAMVAYLRERP